VITLAPPIVIQDRRAAFARFLWPFKPYSPKGLANLQDEAALAEHADYAQFPTRSVAELYAITQQVRRELPRVQVPLLLIFARHDRVVGLDGADYVWQRVASTAKERVVLERGGHIITEDFDKETAFQHIVAFLSKYAI
jgi:esterase/lipase